MRDSYGRNIEYMRISITDRCNLRCRYCMPEGIEQVSMGEILTYEEITRLCKVGVQIGINKIRITGGEPLVRKGCIDLIEMLKAIPGMKRVALTTNGILLEEYCDQLQQVGIDGVNISLDATDPVLFEQITGFDSFAKVLAGLEKMIERRIPVKINAVLIAGLNEDEWEPLVELARIYPVNVRFIELMPIGSGQQQQGVSNLQLLDRLQHKYEVIKPDERSHGNGPAVYYQIPGFLGSIGFISAMHGKFCEQCNRIRLTSEGKLKPCLCYDDSIDLKEILRRGTKEELLAAIQAAVSGKPSAHCFENGEQITEGRPMSKIGG